MIQVLQEVVLVLLITILMGVRHETVQNVAQGKSSQLQQIRVDDAQVQPEPQPDAGRDSPVSHVVLLPGGSAP